MERALRIHLPGGKFLPVAPRHSSLMKAVRGKGNRTTELRFRALLMKNRIRGWRVRPFGWPGNPDFAFPELGIAVFIDGCFWHGCPRCGHLPRRNSAFWRAKIERNRERDRRVVRRLRRAGVGVARVWEHELQSGSRQTVHRFLATIASKQRKTRERTVRK